MPSIFLGMNIETIEIFLKVYYNNLIDKLEFD